MKHKKRLHLSAGSPDAPSSVHYACDGSQSLLTPPQSLLPAKVSGYGGANHGRRAADEKAGGSQQRGVYHLVVRGA